MHRYSILVLCFTLAACSSSSTPTDTSIIPGIEGLDTSMQTTEGEGGESDGFSIDTGIVPGVNVGDLIGTENASVFVTGDGQVDTINNNQKTDIAITGSNHTVNIESNVGTLTVNGNNSIIRFAANVTVDVCNIAGSDNTAERAENVTLNCLVEGSGNLGFE